MNYIITNQSSYQTNSISSCWTRSS